jgi:hypothetical protein
VWPCSQHLTYEGKVGGRREISDVGSIRSWAV